MPKLSSELLYLAAGLICLPVLGCDSGPKLVPMTGVITLDGEPLPFKSVMLEPADGTPGHGAGGYSDGQGNYTLRAIVPGALKDFPGVPPGKYKVVVTEPLIPLSDASFSNSAAQDSDEPSPAIALAAPAPARNAKGSIPAAYTSSRTSPLTIEVIEGTEVMNLELVSK